MTESACTMGAYNARGTRCVRSEVRVSVGLVRARYGRLYGIARYREVEKGEHERLRARRGIFISMPAS